MAEGFQDVLQFTRADADSQEFSLVVFHLQDGLTPEGLKRQFGRFGKVRSGSVKKDKNGKTIGFVNMSNASECARAIAALNGTPPLLWRVILSEPAEVRDQRRRRQQQEAAFNEETAIDVARRIKEFETYQNDVTNMVRRFVDTLNTDGTVDVHGPPADASNGYMHSTGYTSAADGHRGYMDHSELDSLNSDGGQQVIYDPRMTRVEHKPCSVCSNMTAGHCARCKTRYCSRKCQALDWEFHAVSCFEPELPALVLSADGNSRSVTPLIGPGGDAQPQHHQQLSTPGLRVGAGSGRFQSRNALQRGGGRGAARDCGGFHGNEVPDAAAGDHGDHPSFNRGGRGGFRGGRGGSRGDAGGAPFDSPQRAPNGPTRGGARGGGGYRPPYQQPSPAAAPAANCEPLPTSGGDSAPHRNGEDVPAAVSEPQPSVSPVANDIQPHQQTGSVVFTMKPDTTHQVFVSHVDSPNTVYIQPCSERGRYQAMELQLQSSVSTNGEVVDVDGQTMCTAMFDGVWFRGVVRRRNPTTNAVDVFFPDWGNSAELPANSVRPLPAVDVFRQLPALAVRAQLPWVGAGPEGSWSAQQLQLAAALQDETLSAHVVAQEGAAGDTAPTLALFNKDGKNMLTMMSEASPKRLTAAASAALPPSVPATAALPPSAAATAVLPPSAAATAVVPPSAAATAVVPSPPAPPAALRRPGCTPATAATATVPVNLFTAFTQDPPGGEPLGCMPSDWLQEDDQCLPLTIIHEQTLVALGTLGDSCTGANDTRIRDRCHPGQAVAVREHENSWVRAGIISCGADNKYKAVGVDFGCVYAGLSDVWRLPEQLQLDRCPPMVVCARPAGGCTRQQYDATLTAGGLEAEVTVHLKRAVAAVDEEGPLRAVLRVSGQTTELRAELYSCRHLVHTLQRQQQQQGAAAPVTPAATAAAPPAAPAVTPVLQPVPVASPLLGLRCALLPTAMAHPQCVSGRLLDVKYLLPVDELCRRMKMFCDTAEAPSTAPAAGTLVAALCGVPAAAAAEEWQRGSVESADGVAITVRLVDWAVSVFVPLSSVRLLGAAYLKVEAIGLQFGLFGLARDVCAEDQMGFYRHKLVGVEYSMEVKPSVNGILQAVLSRNHGSPNAFQFNDRMIQRIAGLNAAAQRPPSTQATAAPPAQRPPSAQTAAPPAAPRPPFAQAAAPPVQRQPSAQAVAPSFAQPAPRPPSAQTAAGPPVALPMLSDLPPCEQLGMSVGADVPVLVCNVVTASSLIGSPLNEQTIGMWDGLEAALLTAGSPSPPVCVTLQVDQLVLVKSDRGAGSTWCRGSLLECIEDRWLVFLCDHGSMEFVSSQQLHMIPPQLLQWPALSVELHLPGLEGLSLEHKSLVEQLLTAYKTDGIPAEVTVQRFDDQLGYVVRSPIVEAALADAGVNLSL